MTTPLTAPAHPQTTCDDFLGGGLVIEQPAKGFRAGLDAVLLAAAVDDAGRGPARVLDAGAGVGTAGLCVAARLRQVSVVLVEIAAELVALARANVERNGLADRASVIEADLTARAATLERAGIETGAYDVVIANPPYLAEGRHRLPRDGVAAGAFGMPEGTLEAWARFMARVARPGGRVVMIHRADALDEVLAVIGRRFGEIRVLPIHPREGEVANRILVCARKGSRAPLAILPGLVLHEADGAFRSEIKAVLRDGAALPGLWHGAQDSRQERRRAE